LTDANFITDPLAWQAQTRPAKTAVITLGTGERLTYAALDDLASRVAAWLISRLGDPAGQRIAFLGRNSVELLVLALGCERVGAIFVPLNWRLAAPELAALIADCTPVLVVADERFAAAAPGALSGADLLAQIRHRAPAVRRPLDPHRPAILLYTSGTTGQPKGVIVTAANAHAAALNFSLVGEVGLDAVTFSDLPMFHTIGLIAVARTTLMQGGTLVLTDRFTPPRTLAALADASLGITHYFAVPVMIELLEKEPTFAPSVLSRLHAVFVGGAPLVPALIGRFLGYGVALVNGYGMSEAGTVMHMPIDRDAVRANPGSVGFLAPHVEVRLMSDRHDVVDGVTGEIWLRGPSVTPGYWNRPTETAAAFVDGWYRTGDLARHETNGQYRIVDRLKDMYVSGGENVYPAEVERVLSSHPDVADAAVIGAPDPHWGEVGVAFIVPRAGTAFDRDKLTAHVSTRLARYKCPTRYIEAAAIPRSASGKILKPALRDRLSQGEHP